MRAVAAMIAAESSEVDEHDGDPVGRRPGAVAPQITKQTAMITGATIRPRLLMSLEMSTSGAVEPGVSRGSSRYASCRGIPSALASSSSICAV